MTSPNTNSSSTTRASFASALAQKPAPTTKPESSSPSKPSATPTAVSSPSNGSDQSPVVKLPSQSAAAPVPTAAPAKITPIKFGSFAAAAAAAQDSPSSSSGGASNSSGPTLPPRTQSAPPSVIEMEQVAPVISKEPAPVAVSNMESVVVLPSIQEDSQSQQQQQPAVSFNYEHGHQPQQQYQPRPRYHHNPQYHPQQQRYYNPQHQHQHQQQSYYHNPNYRPNYRPRPQYQTEGYYHHPGMAGQGYYPPPPHSQAAYYRPPAPSQVQGQEGAVPSNIPAGVSVGVPAGIPFQRPAPTFNNYVRPVIAPVVPSNIPGFVAAAPIDQEKPVVITPAAPATSAVPVFTKPAPSKIKIVDPSTGKELNFGSKPVTGEIKKEETVAAVRIEEPKPLETKPATESIKPAIVKPVVEPAIVPVAPVAPVTPAKKISIVIKDPSSKQELDLTQVISRPVIKEDLAVEELTAAFSQSTKLEETCESPLPISESPIPTAEFEHDKTILANLNVDDDDVSEDEDEDDYSEYSSDEEEEEFFIPSTVQYNQSISYPEGFIPFKAPTDETGVWLYSREFMLQFRDKCTTTPGDLQERLSAAVEKAKAFANSERINGGDRSHRRDGHHREDRKKRRHHNGGPLGPQAHLLDMNAVLKNRAENAWAPVRSAEELSQVERIIREVKGLLNKLTLEKFHVISDKILALGIMSPDVLSGVIDCVFDKSVSEPRFAPMYAELCYKIVVEELNGLKKSLPANVAPDSQFRRLLVERCQAEYKHKRAWSKKRLEKLLAVETTESTDAKAEESAASSAPTANANVGELTEEDYLLIKLKRRVLGNMRFIGEIFKVGLIGEKIMHSIITELLSNVENPEEEEIECLCRLLMTVGSILDKPEAANFWNQYIGRMNWLISQSGKLSSRVRFMIMDVLELRDKKWKTGKADEGPKTIAQIQKEQQAKERNERERDREYRDQRGGDRSDRGKQGGGSSAPALKFSSGKQQQSKNDEWNRSGPSKSSTNLSRSTSIHRSAAPSQSSPSTPTATETSSAGRFGILNMEESEQEQVHEQPEKSNVAASTVSDEDRVKKIVSLLDELIQMNNYDDIYEELKLCGSKASALSGLLNRAIEGGKKPALLAVIRVFSEGPGLSRSDQLTACKQCFSMIDDLAVDVPSIYEIAGQLYSALALSLPEIFETLAECSDDSAKTRVILQTVVNASNQEEYKAALLKDSKEFVEKNKKPAIENLIKKLNIEF